MIPSRSRREGIERAERQIYGWVLLIWGVLLPDERSTRDNDGV